MAAKKKTARMPRKLVLKGRGGHAACNQVYHNGQRFAYLCLTGRLYAKDCARFAAWMAKAAAWCNEKPRTNKGGKR